MTELLTDSRSPLQLRASPEFREQINEAAKYEKVTPTAYMRAALSKALQKTALARKRAEAKASYDGVPLL